MNRLRKMLAAWLAPQDAEPAEPAADSEPPPQEQELARRTPATPRRELAVAMLLVTAALLFAVLGVIFLASAVRHWS